MGFGHRIYKNYDPRARIVKRVADEVFEILGKEPLIEVAMELERLALSDPYFIDRKLYPNVDFYSGLIYKAIGFPTDMFPVLFTLPRAAGWLAHWVESLDDPDTRIYRPRQVKEISNRFFLFESCVPVVVANVLFLVYYYYCYYSHPCFSVDVGFFFSFLHSSTCVFRSIWELVNERMFRLRRGKNQMWPKWIVTSPRCRSGGREVEWYSLVDLFVDITSYVLILAFYF